MLSMNSLKAIENRLTDLYQVKENLREHFDKPVIEVNDSDLVKQGIYQERLTRIINEIEFLENVRQDNF